MGEIRSIEAVVSQHAEALKRAMDGETVGATFAAGATNIHAMSTAASVCTDSAKAASALYGMARSLASSVTNAHGDLGHADQIAATAIGGTR